MLVGLPTAEQMLRDDLKARIGAIEAYHAAAAELRAIAQDIEAGCGDRPCVEAADYRRLARHAESAACAEEHNPTTNGDDR